MFFIILCILDERKTYKDKLASSNDCLLFLFLFDGLKEHWLIGLSDATFNEQQGRTIGGKLAWCSFCKAELMKARWIRLKCALYLCSGAAWVPHNHSKYSNICPGCKGFIVRPYKQLELSVFRLAYAGQAPAVLATAGVHGWSSDVTIWSKHVAVMTHIIKYHFCSVKYNLYLTF